MAWCVFAVSASSFGQSSSVFPSFHIIIDVNPVEMGITPLSGRNHCKGGAGLVLSKPFLETESRCLC